MSKKKLFYLAIVVVMIAILSFSTLAWFYAEDKVTNKFEISDSLTKFDVDVWEVVPGDTEGTTKDVGKGTKGETDGAAFKDVIPGVEYQKTVHVTNSSGNVLADQYIMAKVTFTNYSALKELGATSADYDCTGMLTGGKFSADGTANCDWWYDAAATVVDNQKDTVTYTFYLKKVLKNGEDVVLFDKVKLPESMDIEDVEDLKNAGFDIKVVAYSVQSANIVDSTNLSAHEAAKAAFVVYNTPTIQPE